jgi:hypothetical protein
VLVSLSHSEVSFLSLFFIIALFILLADNCDRVCTSP